jgi:hypothetical protein
MQGVMRQNQTPPLLVSQSILHQRQIQILIPAVNLVSDNWMSDVSQMDSNLVFAAGQRMDA